MFKYSNLLVRGNIQRCFHVKNFSNLIQKHQKFIDIVKDQGNGSINFTYNYNNNIGIITICNISHRNSICGKMFYELGLIVDDITTNNLYNSMLGLIITGQDDYFCSGADLFLAKDILNSPEKGALMYDYMVDLLSTIRSHNIVSVSLINGPAIGGGSELITSTDFRIMSKNSYIQYIHARIGAAPGWGGINRLISIIGQSKSLYLLGTTNRITSQNALGIGLIDREYDGNSHIDVGVEFISEFFSNSFNKSVKEIKNVIGQSYINENLIDIERKAFTSRWFSDDNKNVIESFINKKK